MEMDFESPTVAGKTRDGSTLDMYKEIEGTPEIDEESKEGPGANNDIRDMAIIHLAKKNLSFELEYIQAVCERFEGKVSS